MPALLRAALGFVLAADVALSVALLASASSRRSSLFSGWWTADTNADAASLGLLRVCVVAIALAVACVPKAYAPGRATANRSATDSAAAPTTTPRRRSAAALATPRRRSAAGRAVTLACQTSTALLAVKALAIALLTPDGAWPSSMKGGCRTGLVPLFAVLAWGAAAATLEGWAGGRLAAEAEGGAGAKSRRENGTSSTPLLDGGGDEEVEVVVAAAAAEADLEAPLPATRTLAVLARIAAADAWFLGAAFAAGGAAAVGGALIPHYTGAAIDDVTLRPPSVPAFRATLAKLAGAAAFTALATATRGGLFWMIGVRLNVRTRTRLFGALLRAEAGFFDAARLGDLVSRLSADTATVSDNLSLQLNVLARSLIGGAVVLGFMLHASWRLSVLAALVLPVIAGVSKVFGRIYRDLAKRSQAALADANAAAEEVLATMATVKAHAAERSARASYGAGLASFQAIQAASGRAYSVYALASTGLPALLATGVLGAGGDLVLAGRMSGGALISFLLYQTSLASTIQTLGDVFSAVAAAVGSADKVVELMERRPRLPPAGTAAPPAFSGAVDLRAVRFAYPARPSAPVLNGLDLSIRPGEVVALVGPSGSGKSSICKLILRLYAPSSGVVLLDGRAVGDYDPRWLARQVGVVSQEPVLYARSVRRNILLGLEEETIGGGVEGEGGGGGPATTPSTPSTSWSPPPCPTQADVEAAARDAHAHDFIQALPRGYETECGDRGVQLSGGQKQRIAIARALVRRPGLLLLDEATSALDATSEQVVQDAIDELARARSFSMVIVAHRLSTVAGAHRVLVVDKGVVVEAGPPEELLAAGGAYAALVRRQLQGGGSSASLRSHAVSGSLRPSSAGG